MTSCLFRWVEGRQKTGYSIFTLAKVVKCRIPFDCYLIKYPVGASIPPHRDTLKGFKHYRMNFISPFSTGGEFITETAIIKTKFFNLFRPDLSTHSVSPVTGKRTRYVFSIGWAVKE